MLLTFCKEKKYFDEKEKMLIKLLSTKKLLILVYKVGKKDGWGCMCRGVAHNISGWEPQLEPAHVHLICHFSLGFGRRKKKARLCGS